MKSNTRSISATSVSEDGQDLTVEMFEDLSVNIYLDNERVGMGEFVGDTRTGHVDNSEAVLCYEDWELVDEIARDLVMEMDGDAEPEPTHGGPQSTAESLAGKDLTIRGLYTATCNAAHKVEHAEGPRGWDRRMVFPDGSTITWILDGDGNPWLWAVGDSAPRGPGLASEASAALGCYVATLEAQIAEIKALGDAIAETASKVREAALEVRAVRMGLE